MSNIALRFYTGQEMKDKLSSIAQWLPIWPKYAELGKFGLDEHSALLEHNGGFYETSKDDLSNEKVTNYNLGTKNFTLCFWSKFKDEYCNKDLSIVDNKIILVMDNKTDRIEYDLTITDTDWHHYAFIRVGDEVKLFIDGTKITSINTTASFNLDNESFIYLGNPIRYCYGDRMYIDDMYLFGTALWKDDTFEVPSLYLPTDLYYRLYEKALEEDNSYYAKVDE